MYLGPFNWGIISFGEMYHGEIIHILNSLTQSWKIWAMGHIKISTGPEVIQGDPHWTAAQVQLDLRCSHFSSRAVLHQ